MNQHSQIILTFTLFSFTQSGIFFKPPSRPSSSHSSTRINVHTCSTCQCHVIQHHAGDWRCGCRDNSKSQASTVLLSPFSPWQEVIRRNQHRCSEICQCKANALCELYYVTVWTDCLAVRKHSCNHDRLDKTIFFGSIKKPASWTLCFTEKGNWNTQI